VNTKLWLVVIWAELHPVSSCTGGNGAGSQLALPARRCRFLGGAPCELLADPGWASSIESWDNGASSPGAAACCLLVSQSALWGSRKPSSRSRLCRGVRWSDEDPNNVERRLTLLIVMSVIGCCFISRCLCRTSGCHRWSITNAVSAEVDRNWMRPG
jgi:hypothetical protein